MKSRIWFVVLSVMAGIAAIGLIVLAANYAVAATSPFTIDSYKAASEPRDGTSIMVSRLTSIPYGIEDSLELSEDGQRVTVSGHGDCVGGETFRLKVTVSQDSFSGLAVGHTEGVCGENGEVSWSAMVNTPGSKSFSPGAAQACGHVVVYFDREGAIVHDWCKAVTLE